MNDNIRILREDEVQDEFSVPDGYDLYFLKLVGIGPEALAKKDGHPSKVLEDTKGFYLVAPVNEIECSLISIIQRAFTDRRSQMED